MYDIYIDEIDIHNESCLCVNDVNDSWFWHIRLGHVSMKTLSKLVINDLAIGLSKLIFDKDLNEKCLTLVNYRSDHGGEFENYVFEMFCNENGFGHNFFAPRTS